MDKTIPFNSIGNDLFADFFCSCGEEIKFQGYDDDYFFNNSEERIISCSGCSKKYVYKWTREGVKVYTKDKEKEHLKEVLVMIEKRMESMERDNLEPDKILCHTAAVRNEIAKVYPKCERRVNDE